MKNNYFSNMTGGELSVFYSLWNQAGQSGMMQQDAIIIKAMDFHRELSTIPMIDCERNMLLEITSRWNNEHSK